VVVVIIFSNARVSLPKPSPPGLIGGCAQNGREGIAEGGHAYDW